MSSQASVTDHLGRFFHDVSAFQTLVGALEAEASHGVPREDRQTRLAHGLEEVLRAAADVEERLRRVDPGILDDTRAMFRRLTGSFFCRSPSIARALAKPRGYAGDHELLDMYYTESKAPGGIEGVLDAVHHATPAVRAVLRRRDYAIEWLSSRLAKRPCAKVVDLACGPCRVERDLLDRGRGTDASFVAVDHDPVALAYARRVLGRHAARVELVEANALRIARSQAVPPSMAGAGLVVSLGLFDYLHRATAVGLLRTLRGSLAPGGELLVGNFARDNPTRTFMEWVADWVLVYRTQEEFLQLFLDAGFEPEHLVCEREVEGGLVLLVTARAP